MNSPAMDLQVSASKPVGSIELAAGADANDLIIAKPGKRLPVAGRNAIAKRLRKLLDW
jgi:hypothetical protein